VFATNSTAFGSNPLAVVERRRQSPLGLSAPVGPTAGPIVMAPGRADQTQPDDRPDPKAGTEANRPDDLFRINRALREVGAKDSPADASPADNNPADSKEADQTDPIASLKRFQADRGLKVDGLVNPGGPTDRALDNARRRRRHLQSGGRTRGEETLDDRLSVFITQQAERARIAEDDYAALMASRTGRLLTLSLAGTTDEATTRPLLEQTLATLRAEALKKPLKEEEDDEEGDGDEGDEDGGDGDEGENPGRPPTESEQRCIELWATYRRAEKRVEDAEQELKDLWSEFYELAERRDVVLDELKGKAKEYAVALIFKRISLKKSTATPGAAGKAIEVFSKTLGPMGYIIREVTTLHNLVLSYERLGEQGQRLHDDVIIPLQDEELVRLRDLREAAAMAKAKANCHDDPSRSKP